MPTTLSLRSVSKHSSFIISSLINYREMLNCLKMLAAMRPNVGFDPHAYAHVAKHARLLHEITRLASRNPRPIRTPQPARCMGAKPSKSGPRCATWLEGALYYANTVNRLRPGNGTLGFLLKQLRAKILLVYLFPMLPPTPFLTGSIKGLCEDLGRIILSTLDR